MCDAAADAMGHDATAYAMEGNGAEGEDDDADDDAQCCVCSRPDSESLMLLGDGKKGSCPTACHTFCCSPPLKKPPAGEWYCDTCK